MTYSNNEIENRAGDTTEIPVVQKSHREHFRKMGLDAGIILIGQLLGRFVVRFGRTILIARILGPTNMGIFGLFSTIPELILTVGNLGLGSSVLYYVSKENRDPKEVVGSILFFAVTLGLLMIAGGAFFMQFDFFFKDGAPVIKQYTSLILLSVPFFFLKLLLLNFLVTQKKIPILSAFGFLESSLPLILFLGFWVTLHNGLQAAAWSWFISNIILCISSLVLSFFFGGFPPKVRLNSIREFFIYGIKSYLPQCFQLALLRSDFLFVSSMCGMKELGFYVIATRTAEIFLALTDSLIVPFIPIIFGMDKNSIDRFTPVVVKFLFWTMTIISLLLLAFGPLVIHILFGNEFKDAYLPFLLLLPGLIVLSINPFVRIDLFGRNLMLKVTYSAVVGLAINLTLNFLFIPKWGIYAAAINSSIGYIISTFMVMLLYSRVSGNSFKKIFLLSNEDIRMLRKKMVELNRKVLSTKFTRKSNE